VVPRRRRTMRFLPRMPSRYLAATRRVDVLARHMSSTSTLSDRQEVVTIHYIRHSLLNTEISSPLSSSKKTLQYGGSSSTGRGNSMPLTHQCLKPWHLGSRYPLLRTPCFKLDQFQSSSNGIVQNSAGSSLVLALAKHSLQAVTLPVRSVFSRPLVLHSRA
jgi:hypothetical protein